MYDIGIIGGMGPEATVEMFRRFVSYVEAECDQEHMNICVLNDAKTPDRTKAIMNGNDDPVININHSISELINLGCPRFVVACNTAHYYKDQFLHLDKIKFIDMIDCTLSYIEKKYHGYTVCVLGTNATVNAGVYSQGSEGHKIIYPSPKDQEIIMQAITDTKKGLEKDEIVSKIEQVIQKIDEAKIVFILGCTELSIYHQKIANNYNVVDAMDLTVLKAIIESGYRVKKKFQENV